MATLHLTHGVIIEILSRLPANTFVRFKRVCKQWFDSIIDPSFIKTHLNRAIERDSVNLFLFSKPCRNKKDSNIIPHTHLYRLQQQRNTKSFNDYVEEMQNPCDLSFNDFQVLGSCIGLACLGKGRVVCLLNPCTKEYKIVKIDKELIFNYQFSYGLGFDRSVNDYVLAQIVGSIDDMSFRSQVNVYSLNDGSCSTVTNVQSYDFTGRAQLGTYWNGALYWVGFAKDYSTRTIIYFVIGEKMMQELPTPATVNKKIDMMTLGMLGGQLCVLCTYYRDDYEIWVINQGGVTHSWCKLFSMDRKKIPYNMRPTVVCLSENGQVLLRVGSQLVIYDPKGESGTEVQYHRITWTKINSIVAHLASLVTLKSGSPSTSEAYVGKITGVKSLKKRKRKAQM